VRGVGTAESALPKAALPGAVAVDHLASTVSDLDAAVAFLTAYNLSIMVASGVARIAVEGGIGLQALVLLSAVTPVVALALVRTTRREPVPA